MSNLYAQRFQWVMLVVAVSALILYYVVDLGQLVQATFVLVRDLKAQSEATASKVSALMKEEGE